MRKYILLFIYCLMAVTCLGDTDIPYNETDYSQSPNISTLGQFGDIPVSQFTGVPKISIPICKIEINGKSIPITLDYHTSGIRMEQKPGWIGAGWSLMAAGAIVRLQNGGNDEYQHFMKKKNIIYGGQGYFQNLNDLNNDNWGTQSFLNDFIENYNSTYLSLNQDLDPDEFRFDFLGHSGSFFKDCQGQWQIRSKENFRIADMSLGKVPYEAPDNLGKPDVIVGFTLIGDNGGLIIGNQADYSCEYAYDLNGNITSLTRNGVAMSVQAFDFKCWNFGMIDDAKFEYDGNQLIRAYDDCESLTYAAAMDFKARTAKSNQYSWDANGNMTSDMNRNITKITYNFLNLPYEIHFADGHINRYTYTSDGRKLRVEYMISNTGVIDARDYGEFSSSPLPSRVNEVPNSAIEGTFNDTHDAVSLQTIMTKSYCGDLEYLNNEIERVDNDYGYWAGGRYHYYIKDYQGNVRAVIDEAGRLEEVNNYYPYGGLMGAAGSGVQSRKYGGKELDRENGLDWYDSQARHYDPTAGRTPTMDSKAESFYSMSPYLWCAGNPVRNIDPDGSFVRKNTHYNESYPYVVVFPMNYKNPENGPSLEPDFLAAERIGTPILLVKDAQDFADALDMYPEHGFKGFVINSHGDSGEFLIGETNITTGDEDQMKILKDGLKGKSVFIEACNTGAGNKGKEFTVKFARLTQSTTITSRHNILMGYNYRGGLGLTFASSFEKFLWKLGFNLGNDYRISENGSKARNIYHLSIDINDGFEWEDFGNECIIPLYYDD